MANQNSEYSKLIGQRLHKIMVICDLDISGFAEMFNKSTSHIYGIVNSTRMLSDSFAKEIGDKFGFEGAKIFNLNIKLPETINKAPALKRFKLEYRDNPEYFISSKSKRSVNTFIEEVLLKSDCFKDGKRSLSEIRDYCRDKLNREFVNDQLSKGLRYAVAINKLHSKKEFIILKNGSRGKRLVDFYY